MKKTIDHRIGKLLDLQFQLMQFTKKWAKGAQEPAEIEVARRQAIMVNHLRYLDLIPAYRQWSESNGIEQDADIQTIINQLMLTGHIFKSYDPSWLENNNFRLLTDWLATIYIQRLDHISVDGIENLTQWRNLLRKKGVFVSYSSGSSGRFAFIPRDPITWKALITNSNLYYDYSWLTEPDGKPGSFDCLIAGLRGQGMGIQGAAVGLAKMATRTHYMFDAILDEEMVQTATTGKNPAPMANCDIQRTAEFIQGSIDEKRALLIFGTPFMIRRLCEQIIEHCKKLPVHNNSIVVTGGGWKSFLGEKLPRVRLGELIQQAFDIDRQRYIDAYSSVEVNCTLISCREFRYHIPPLIEPILLDEALMGMPGQQGFGLLGFLDPFAVSYPGFLITGDQGHLMKGQCDCGLSGWSISGEIGRARNQEMKGCGGVIASFTA